MIITNAAINIKHTSMGVTDSSAGFIRQENTDDENINIEDEVENERGRIVDRIIRGEQIM